MIVESAPADVTAAELVAIPRDRDLAFFFDAGRIAATLDKLMAVFGPRVLLHTPYDDVPPEKAFVLFYVPAECTRRGARHGGVAAISYQRSA